MTEPVEIEFVNHMHRALDETLRQLQKQPSILIVIAACADDDGKLRLSLGGWGDRPNDMGGFLRIVADNADLSPSNIIESRVQ